MFFIVIQYGHSQSFDFTEMTFNYSFSMSKNELTIKLKKRQDSTDVSVGSEKLIDYKYSPEKEKRTIEKSFKKYRINNQKFDELVLLFENIKALDLIKEFSGGTDGYMTYLELNNGFNSVNYKVFSPEMKDKETELKDYLIVCLKLFEIAEIDPEKYL